MCSSPVTNLGPRRPPRPPLSSAVGVAEVVPADVEHLPAERRQAQRVAARRRPVERGWASIAELVAGVAAGPTGRVPGVRCSGRSHRRGSRSVRSATPRPAVAGASAPAAARSHAARRRRAGRPASEVSVPAARRLTLAERRRAARRARRRRGVRSLATAARSTEPGSHGWSTSARRARRPSVVPALDDAAPPAVQPTAWLGDDGAAAQRPASADAGDLAWTIDVGERGVACRIVVRAARRAVLGARLPRRRSQPSSPCSAARPVARP